MKSPNILLLILPFLITCMSRAQNIGGVVNDYAAVTAIAGAGISVSSATAFSAGDRTLLIQMKGAVIDTTNTSSFGDIQLPGGAGNFEFLNVSSIAGNVITAASSLTQPYDVVSGNVQVVRVPKYCSPIVTSPITCPAWNMSTGEGGIIAFEAGTLTLNSSINASGKGFSGGNFATSTFCCDNGNFCGVEGINGGQKGEGIAAYVIGRDGLKGKQANGGGASNCGNSGGGGGANGGAGGFGGNQYSGCSSLDDRGIGGINLSTGFSSLFLGGGGGGAFQDNGLACTKGGNGGGIIYIKANVLISNNGLITASGVGVTVLSDAEGAGGGGAGGTIFLECPSVSGNLTVKTDGGSGGGNNNSVFITECHGPGGGGGGGIFAFSPATLPSNINYSSAGGVAGKVNNPSSSCFGTTNGATAGTGGISLPGLPAVVQALNVPTLSVTQSTIICSGESKSLTVSGASTYSWSTGSTNTMIVVSPTLTSAYTVAGTGTGTNSCKVLALITLSVTNCMGINALAGQDELKIYPNPTSGRLFIETETPVKIIICDGTGRTVQERIFQKGDHSLDMSNYAAGSISSKQAALQEQL